MPSDNNYTKTNEQNNNPAVTEVFDIPPLPSNAVNSHEQKGDSTFPPAIGSPKPGDTKISSQISQKKRKKVVATILGLTILMGGLATGIFLSMRSQEIRDRAQTTEGTSPPSATLPPTGSAEDIMCGGISQMECPPGYVCDLPIGSPPDATGVCRITSPKINNIDCLGVKAYKINNGVWTLLSQTQLKKLTAGEKIYLTVTGKANDPSMFTKAKFKINNGNIIEVQASTNTKPKSTSEPSDTIEIYTEYVIPEKITSFTIQASIFHSTYGWIGDL